MATWFLGIPVPDGPWLDRIQRQVPTAVQPLVAADLHMTVAFCGACGPERAAAAWEVVAAAAIAPFDATLGAIEPLGNPRSPSALSLRLIAGDREASALIARWRAPALAAAEAEPDRRPPLPHVTVARIVRRATDAERRAALAWARQHPPLDVTVRLDRIALYTAAPDRERRYRLVTERPLG